MRRNILFLVTCSIRKCGKNFQLLSLLYPTVVVSSLFLHTIRMQFSHKRVIFIIFHMLTLTNLYDKYFLNLRLLTFFKYCPEYYSRGDYCIGFWTQVSNFYFLVINSFQGFSWPAKSSVTEVRSFLIGHWWEQMWFFIFLQY